MSDNAADGAPGRQTKRGPAVDLDAMTVQELAALIEVAEAMRREKQEEAKASMLAKWQAEAAGAGLSLESILAGQKPPQGQGQGKTRKAAAGNVPVKYRGPNGEEWSGRGRLPKWVQVAEAEGKSREEFRV